MSGGIDHDMLKALASFTGPVKQCPLGAATKKIKRRTTRSIAARRFNMERHGEFYRCEVCTMWHRNGFNYKRDEKLIDEEISRGIEPSTWVWRTPPNDATSEDAAA
jgi:hypothetical protein